MTHRTRLAALAAGLILIPSAAAQSTYTWDNSSSSFKWNTNNNGSPTSGKNWTVNSATGTVWANGNDATFLSTQAGVVGTIDVTEIVTAGTVSFFSNGYTLISTGGSGRVTAATFNVQPGITATINCQTSGLTGTTKSGTGTLVLGNTMNAFGSFNVSAGTLVIATTNALQFTPALALNGSATFSSGTSTGFTTAAGNLSVSGTPTIALGTGSHTLTFGSFTDSGLTSLTITGWQGTAGSTGTAGHLLFSAPSGLAGSLSKITFAGYGNGAEVLPSGELVPAPVPEPVGVFGLAVVGLGFARRLRRRPVRA
jgi:MYXO-CTERM domain-containing protein